MTKVKTPNKSFLLTGLLAVAAAAAPFVNDAAERCCGIEITPEELQHLLYLFVGSAGVGGAVGIHKRHVAGKVAGNGGAHGPGNGAGGIASEVLSALLHANPPRGGVAVSGAAGVDSNDINLDAEMAKLEDEDDDPDDDLPPKGG